MGYTTAEIIQKARDLTGMVSGEVSDAKVLEFINIEYPKILNRVYFRNKNYWYDEWTTALVAGQSKYSLKKAVEADISTHVPWVYGQCDISKIEIKYETAQQYFGVATQTDAMNYTTDLQYFADTQPKDQPFYILYIDYFEIYPTPTVTVANGLKMTGTKSPYKLTLDTTTGCWWSSVDDLLPEQYQDILVWAIRPHMFRYRKQRNDVRQAEMDLQQKELDMVYNISYTNTEPITWLSTDYSSLC